MNRIPATDSRTLPDLAGALSAIAHPGPEFRALPFWSWNAKLDPAELRRQVPLYLLSPHPWDDCSALPQGKAGADARHPDFYGKGAGMGGYADAVREIASQIPGTIWRHVAGNWDRIDANRAASIAKWPALREKAAPVPHRYELQPAFLTTSSPRPRKPA